MSIELSWGAVRRSFLRTFFPGYVRRMADCRQGVAGNCPIDPVDSRDMKYYRNLGSYYWTPEDDRFAWRDRIPFARAGLCELFLIGGGLVALGLVLSFYYWPLGVVPGVLALGVIWFFRNPGRVPPKGPGLVVSPADGKVVVVEEIEYDEFIGGPAILIGIFLSVFNVHINRSPISARVLGLTYRRGKFLNALRPESARENEQMAIRLEEPIPPFRRMIVRQIAGAIARRIVCWLAPGDELGRGDQVGMIKLGSRTELILPRESSMAIRARVGQHVKAGESILVEYV